MNMALPPCPSLPPVDRPWLAAELAGLDASGAGVPLFFTTALACAQSRWMSGLPAQALLMLNRAFSADLADDETVLLREHPWPYAAVAWMVGHAPADAYLGNPRRHYQHLATRMNHGPLREIRILRAWACWAIVRKIRPEFPADEEQLVDESVVEPTVDQLAMHPAWGARPRERREWLEVMGESQGQTGFRSQSR